MFQKSIDYDTCISCMACERICANSRVIQKNDQGKPEFKLDYKCIYCGHCLAICPQKAITFKPGIPADQTDQSYQAGPLPMDPAAQAQDERAVRDLLNATRSNRFFLDKAVDRTIIAKILDTMVRAPSAGNEQNRNFYILDDKARLIALEEQVKIHFQKLLELYKNPMLTSSMALTLAIKTRKAAGKSHASPTGQRMASPSLRALYRINKKLLQGIGSDAQPVYLRDAPAVMIITSGPKFTQLHKAFYKGDASIAATYGTLMAKGLGLSTCWLGLLEIAANKNKQIKQSLGIGELERVDAALALGYSALVWHQIPPRGPVKVVWSSTKGRQT